MNISEALAHAGDPNVVAPEIIEEALRQMPGYLWVVDNYIGDTGLPEFDFGTRPRRLIRCGRCGNGEVEERRGRRWQVSYIQNAGVACPYCGEFVTVKHVSRGVKGLRNRLNVIWYHKSVRDPGVVVARAAKFTMDYRETDPTEPWELEPEIWPTGLAVFDAERRDDLRLKAIPIWESDGKVWDVTGHMWQEVKAMNRLNTGDGAAFEWQKPETVILRHTLDEAIERTPLERSWSPEWHDEDHHYMRALDLATRYACVEYLTRLGMTDIVQARIDSDLPAGLINWRGRTKGEVLRLDNQTLGQLKHFGVTPTPALLVLLKWLRGAGITMDIPAANRLAGVLARLSSNWEIENWIEEALGFHDRSRRRKTLKYMANQAGKDAALRPRDFTDYWHLCRIMGENLADPMVAYPSNLPTAENRLLERQRRDKELADAVQNAKLDRLIQRRLKLLNRAFGFDFGGITLRPVSSVAELKAEGDALHHCVGTYAKRYAGGDTVICVLRRNIQPDVPWRTVEISAKTGKVVQDRGWHNDRAPGMPLTEEYRAALDLFWEAWGERDKRLRA